VGMFNWRKRLASSPSLSTTTSVAAIDC
jgi:hypothetical protein